MWRFAMLLTRNGSIAASVFPDHVLSSLAPALAAAVVRDVRVQRLVVNLPPEDLDPSVASVFPPLFDAMVEYWFHSADEAAGVIGDLSRNEHIREAVSGVINGQGSVAWLAEVFPKKPENGSTRVKFLAGGEVAEGWTVEQAQRYWSEVHPVVAQSAPKVWSPLTRYTQFHGRRVQGLPAVDWLARLRFVPLSADMGFARQQDFLANYTNDEYLSIVRPDEEKFSRPGEMLAFVSGEERDFLTPR
jgi:hypothetical protein